MSREEIRAQIEVLNEVLSEIVAQEDASVILDKLSNLEERLKFLESN